MKITTVLGDSREVVRAYPGGEWECPWCCTVNTVKGVETCCNPGCDANPWWTPEGLSNRREQTAKIREEAEARKRNHESAMQRIHEEREELAKWRTDTAQEARSVGACTHPKCLWPKYHGGLVETPKHVRHRKHCPNRNKY